MTSRPPAHTHDLPPDLAAMLSLVVPDGGGFGHREHVHLAFRTVREHGTSAAIAMISRWIRHIAAYQRVPQKFNATVTTAWTQLVGHHVDADPRVDDFGEFVDRHPALLDKRLLRHHYSSSLLASAAARRECVPPDLAPFPWS